MDTSTRAYEPCRQLSSFAIRGFQYWDGALVLEKLRTGMELELVAEADNPHDPEAVAIYYAGHKLGYVPKGESGRYWTLLHFGHDVYETRILKVDDDADPWEQVRVAIFVKDAR